MPTSKKPKITKPQPPNSRLGCPNKPKEGKELVQRAVFKAWSAYAEQQFLADIQAIEDPRERATLMCQYAKYIAPALRAADVSIQAAAERDELADRLRALSAIPEN